MPTKAELQADIIGLRREVSLLRERVAAHDYSVAAYERLLREAVEHIARRDQSLDIFATFKHWQTQNGNRQAPVNGREAEAGQRRKALCRQWARLAVKHAKSVHPETAPTDLAPRQVIALIKASAEEFVRSLDRAQPRKKPRSIEHYRKKYQADVRRCIELGDLNDL
ncbi:MAG: hypothetical protein V2I24_14120 [Halieaceae bacterium]|nr:hypothetical protein [Halieaceae bacterium]